MPSASLVSQPQGARQLKMGTGLTLIEIEKLSVGVLCEQVHERNHRTGRFRTWTLSIHLDFDSREVPTSRRQRSVPCELLTGYLTGYLTDWLYCDRLALS